MREIDQQDLVLFAINTGAFYETHKELAKNKKAVCYGWLQHVSGPVLARYGKELEPVWARLPVRIAAAEELKAYYERHISETEALPFHTVAVFLVDRSYGGPEEGGWWYTHGRPVKQTLDGVEPGEMVKSFSSEAEAVDWSNTLQEKLDAGPNKGRRSINSVLSTGRYEAHVCEDCYPEPFPKERPHYE